MRRHLFLSGALIAATLATLPAAAAPASCPALERLADSTAAESAALARREPGPYAFLLGAGRMAGAGELRETGEVLAAIAGSVLLCSAVIDGQRCVSVAAELARITATNVAICAADRELRCGICTSPGKAPAG